jgi:hypothetical protein
MAKEASARMDTHEEVCAERWGHAKKTMDAILRVLAWGTAGLIGSMGSLIVWLATHPH